MSSGGSFHCLRTNRLFEDQPPSPPSKPAALDFFAGGGLATEALKPFFKIVWANDIDRKKAAVFQANHARKVLQVGPIEEISGVCLPSSLLSWASFPCQDLSLAGNLSGIGSSRVNGGVIMCHRGGRIAAVAAV